MADEDDAAPAPVMRLRLAMHFRHQRAGGVDGEKVARRGFFRHRPGDAMGGKDDRTPPRRRFAQILDEHDAPGLERVDDGFVVHDLVPHVDRRPIEPERPLDDVDGAHDARAKAARLAEDDPKGWFHRRRAGSDHAAHRWSGGAGKSSEAVSQTFETGRGRLPLRKRQRSAHALQDRAFRTGNAREVARQRTRLPGAERSTPLLCRFRLPRFPAR